MELTTRSFTTRVLVKDHSFVGAARRLIRELAEHAGLSGETLGKVDLLSTELATNLVKHADGGEILVFEVFENDDKHSNGICLLSIDRGPGIEDLDHVLIDGYSTTGTMGAGLGALKRLSNKFEITSTVNKGTVIACTVSKPTRAPLQTNGYSPIDWAAIAVPHPSERRCGDTVTVSHSDDATNILIIDGSGHGEGAAHAAEKGAEVFAANPFDEPLSIINHIHTALSGTRGASLAVLNIDHGKDRIKFVGVGNITCRINTRVSSKGCVSVQGIAGVRMSSLKEYTYDWGPSARLLMYSDGTKSAASLDDSPGKSSILSVAEIYRDFCRLTDDTSIVVVKDKRR